MIPSLIIFLDLETTGLLARLDFPLEIAMTAVQTPRFNVVDTFWSPIDPGGLKNPDGEDWETRLADNAFVTEMHTKSGLLAELRARKEGDPYATLKNAEARALAFVDKQVKHVAPNARGERRPYLAGSNPDFDRRFLEAYFPALARKFHYRNLDVNSLFILRELLADRPKSEAAHRALDDCEQARNGVLAHFEWMRSVFGAART